jgi:hypothetical protein
VLTSTTGIAQPVPMAKLTFISETGVPHSAAYLEYANGEKKWLGFQPGRRGIGGVISCGRIDTSDRSGNILTQVSFAIPDDVLRRAEQRTVDQYRTRHYVLLKCDCVSFTADLARNAGLKVPPPPNFRPSILVENLQKLNP